MPEVKKRDDQDQGYEDGGNDRDGDKPHEHELAVANVGRRLGNADNVVKSPEKSCEEFNHGGLLRVA
jgi:hypothetical protein